MKDHLQRRIYDFIAEHGLHTDREYKTNLEKLKTIFEFKRLPATSPVCSLVRWIESPTDPQQFTPQIWVRDQLDDRACRLAIAHEVGHILLEHTDSHSLFRVAPYFHTRQEREAWQAAAILLISPRAILDSPHVRWLEHATLVPGWLINEYPHIQRIFSLPVQARSTLFQ